MEVGSTDPQAVIMSMWRYLADPLRWLLDRLGFVRTRRAHG